MPPGRAARRGAAVRRNFCNFTTKPGEAESFIILEERTADLGARCTQAHTYGNVSLIPLLGPITTELSTFCTYTAHSGLGGLELSTN